MIAYSELVTALRSWRERNGLPNFGIDPGPSQAPAVIRSSPPVAAAPVAAAPPAPAPAPRTAPPAAPPRAPAPLAAIEIEDEIDASELESEDGSDFAMAFGVSPEPRTGELGAIATFDDDMGDDSEPIKLEPETDDSTLVADDDGTPRRP